MTGALIIVGTAAFGVAATVLSMTFDWPGILRQPASVVLPAFAAGAPSLVWTWFAVAWTYAILTVPILLLPAALTRRTDAALRAALSGLLLHVLLPPHPAPDDDRQAGPAHPAAMDVR